jgi:hypothetical protein
VIHRMLGVAAVLVVLVVLGAAAPVSAHDELGFVGTLVSVDLARNSITLTYKEEGKDATAKIALTPKTRVTRDKKAIPRTTLKAGLNVSITALGCEGEDLEALEIRITSATAK